MSTSFVDPLAARYRQTPLRRHVEQQMGWSSHDAWRKSLLEVLALCDLRERILDEPNCPSGTDERLRQALTLESFFYGGILPELDAIYANVKVRHSENTQDEHEELTELIRHLDQTGDDNSILLATRSGAGKTVAARKAFCDCIVAAPGASKPALAQYLPCWIEMADTEIAHDSLIETLILRACGLEEQLTADALRLWLQHPDVRLLLFFDLNAWPTTARGKVAQELPRFLNRYRSAGHRAVVAYRSSAIDEGPRNTLLNSKRFQLYELVPLSVSEVEKYLHDVRVFENSISQSAFQRPRAEHLHPRIPEESRHLRQLLRRNAGQQGTEGSVISTPLLMHFASRLEPSVLAEVQTLSDLYDQVVDQHINRELKRLDDKWLTTDTADSSSSTTDLRDGPDPIRQAMTRLAVLIVNQPEDTVSVTREEFEESLRHPQDGGHDQLGGVPWWPRELFWHEAPWVIKDYSAEEVRLLREFSLVRGEGHHVRFIHDSLIYYFAARALRRPRPTHALPTNWPAHATTQLRSWPGARREVAEFLGGMLSDEQFQALFLELLAGPADTTTARHLDALIRGAAGKIKVATALANESVRRSGWWGLKHPDLFLPELHEALCVHPLSTPPEERFFDSIFNLCDSVLETTSKRKKLSIPTFPEFASRLEDHMRQVRRPWLRTIHPRPRELCFVMTDHAGEVTCVAEWINPQNPDDIRVASSSMDGTVKLWNPDTGVVDTIIEHEGCVRCLHVLDNGCVISGSDDGLVKQWDPITGKPSTIIGDESGISCLAVLENGCVVAGSYGGRVTQWTPETGNACKLFENEDRVSCLVGLPDGSVIAGSNRCSVKLWSNGSQFVSTIFEPSDPKSVPPLWRGKYVAVLEDESVVIACPDATVKLWNYDTKEVETIIELDSSYGGEHAIELLQDDVVAYVSRSTDRQYSLQLWNPTTKETEYEWDFEVPILCLVGLSNGMLLGCGRSVVLATCDSEAREFKFKTINQQTDGISCLAVLSESRVASGSRDHIVKVWDPQVAIGAAEYHHVMGHRGTITDIKVLPDGRVVSRGIDGNVKLWNPASGGVTTIGKNVRDVGDFSKEMSLRLLQNGAVAWVTEDEAALQIWTSTNGKVKTIIIDEEEVINERDEYRVESLVTLPGGKVVSQHSWTVGPVSREWDMWLSNPETGHVEKIIPTNRDDLTPPVVLPDGSIVFGSNSESEFETGSREFGRVNRWSPTTKQIETILEVEGQIDFLDLLPDGRIVFGQITDRLTRTGIVNVLNVATRQVDKFSQHAADNYFHGVLSDGSIVVESISDSHEGDDSENPQRHWEIKLLNPTTMLSETIVQGTCSKYGNSDIRSWSLPDGHVALVSADGTVKLWSRTTKCGAPIIQCEDSIRCLLALPDGRIAVASGYKDIRLWSPKDRSVLSYPAAFDIHCLACSADGNQLYAGLANGELLMLQVESPRANPLDICAETMS